MKKQSNHKAIANGIEYQLQLRGRFYAVRFTDPRSHQRQRIPTKCSNQTAAHAFAANYLQKYVPGESGKLTVGQLVENLLAHQQVKFPERSKKALAAWNSRIRDKLAHIDARDLKGRDILNYLHWCVGVATLVGPDRNGVSQSHRLP